MIYKGTGKGQYKKITTNSSTTITVESSWTTSPAIGSEFSIALVRINNTVSHNTVKRSARGGLFLYGPFMDGTVEYNYLEDCGNRDNNQLEGSIHLVSLDRGYDTIPIGKIGIDKALPSFNNEVNYNTIVGTQDFGLNYGIIVGTLAWRERGVNNNDNPYDMRSLNNNIRYNRIYNMGNRLIAGIYATYADDNYIEYNKVINSQNAIHFTTSTSSNYIRYNDIVWSSVGLTDDGTSNTKTDNDELAFIDEFELDTTDTTPAGWTNISSSGGSWDVKNELTYNNYIQQTTTTNAVYILANGNSNWKDYYVQASIKPGSKSYYAGISGRVTDEENMYVAALYNDTIYLRKRTTSAGWSTLSSTAFSYNTTTSYNLKLDMSGSTSVALTVYVDGVQKITYNDSSSPHASGKIAVYTDYGLAAFDDIIVDGPPPKPVNVKAEGGEQKIQLTWSAADGATGYNIKTSTEEDGTYTNLTTGVTQTSYSVDTDIVNGAVRFYKVVAESSTGGDSEESDIARGEAGVLLDDDFDDDLRRALADGWTSESTTLNPRWKIWSADGDVPSSNHSFWNHGAMIRAQFTDDTIDQLPDMWTDETSNGTWEVEVDDVDAPTNKWLAQKTAVYSSKRLISAGSTSWKDYTLYARVKPGSTSYHTGVTFRFTDVNNYYYVLLRNNSGTLQLQLGERISGTPYDIQSKDYTFDTSTWYDFKIIVSGTSIKVYVDDTLEFDITGEDTHASGKIGLQSSYTAQFDEIWVKSDTIDGLLLCTNGDTIWSDYSVETEIKTNTYTDYLQGLAFRVTDSENYYYAGIKNGTTAFISKLVNATETSLTTTSFAYTTGQSYSLKVEVEDNSIKLYIDGDEKISTTDSSFTSGKIGLVSTDFGHMFDNLKVKSLKKLDDDFESYTTNQFPDEKWTDETENGSWQVKTDGSTQVLDQGSAAYSQQRILSAGDTSLTDYTLEGKIKPGQTDHHVGYLFRFTDTDNHYYTWLRNNSGTLELTLGKYVSGTPYAITSKAFTYTTTSWYSFKVEVTGTSIKVYVDDTLELSATDSAFSSGKIGVRSAGLAKFDDIKVTTDIIFEEDFQIYSEDDFPDYRWTDETTNGSWQVKTDGNTKVLDQGTATYSSKRVMSTGDITWTDYTLEGKVKPGQTDFHAGYLFRFTDVDNYYYAYFRNSSGTLKISLGKVVSGSTIGIQNVNYTYTTTSWYTIKVEAIGTSIKVYVDDVLKINKTDSAFSFGKIGIQSAGIAKFDDVYVKPE